ncbi:MAG: hypothetical protein HeimC2_41000 [Candidatus Heimdallarchaeota archaeon LC_2]|nr:MAG: hypothetical protein HeimC2_41000 [Candidatus Heimdallarchaeota archaeon LC_2]
MFSVRVFPHIPKDIIADDTVQFIGDVYVGSSSEFGKNCIVDGSKFRISINSNCKIGDETNIVAKKERIDIGSNVIIGKNCIIGVSIPKNTIIQDNQTIVKSYN